jgi:hypothetical protein
MSMTITDWEMLARVFRAGEREADPPGDESGCTSGNMRLAMVLAVMGDECDAIARALGSPPPPVISCASCGQLRPGPGVLIRTTRGVTRLCTQCATEKEEIT